jgi:hypothetical protein
MAIAPQHGNAARGSPAMRGAQGSGFRLPSTPRG